ncbi:hypothetical protein MPNT_10014 [Candidatus Methylacidithermus pantelleriae]|uniref:RDD family protein n=1 Tax=Candidatus Methylacidithermus pantelleriae TaxID=2744239 RepID=A0A8J2FR60_9BACT|nr:hypothetical protein MPNT_10014 [Candidatus Methylacidithermus pantelleriae]
MSVPVEWLALLYFVCLSAWGLGLVWMLRDPRRQCWHDKLAKTLVLRIHQKFQQGGSLIS